MYFNWGIPSSTTSSHIDWAISQIGPWPPYSSTLMRLAAQQQQGDMGSWMNVRFENRFFLHCQGYMTVTRKSWLLARKSPWKWVDCMSLKGGEFPHIYEPVVADDCRCKNHTWSSGQSRPHEGQSQGKGSCWSWGGLKCCQNCPRRLDQKWWASFLATCYSDSERIL